jgi:hypothetical protein
MLDYLEVVGGVAAVRQHLVAEVEGRKLGTLYTMKGKETGLLGSLAPCQPFLYTEILHKISQLLPGSPTVRDVRSD